jgi:hypothetical protein
MVSGISVTGDPNYILQKPYYVFWAFMVSSSNSLPTHHCMCAGQSYYLLSIRKLIIWSEKLSVLNDLLKSTRPSFLLLFCGFA